MNDNLKLEKCPYCRFSFGDWVFRSHLVSCSKNPWTYITADPATLPPIEDGMSDYVLLTVLRKSGERGVYKAEYQILENSWSRREVWYVNYGDIGFEELEEGDTAVAWQPWPEPAPIEPKEG